MLVLTRRVKEKIVFPEIDVIVELMSINGNRARLGVKAPDDLRILRQEIAEAATFAEQRPARFQRPSKFEHDLRNRLNSAKIAAELLTLQLSRGQVDESESTLARLREDLSRLARQVGDRKPQGGSKRDTSSRRALLVEDDANESRLLAGYLRMTGFEVDTAGDGADALDYLSNHNPPDVVLLDMLMPRCDGPATLTAIRRNPDLDGLKVFAVSGTSPKTMGVQIGPEGIDRWFDKPIDPQELVQEMTRQLTPT